MTQNPRIFNQVFPTANIDTNLMTVDTGHSVSLSVFVANQSANEDAISVAMVPYDEGNTTQPNYIAYSLRLIGNGIIVFGGLFMGSGDQIRVTSKNGTCSFTASGLDQT